MYVTKSDVNKVFCRLRNAGYWAEQNFACCTTCGWAEIPDEFVNKAVFYHEQDNEAWNKFNNLYKNLYLAWSGDGDEIVRIIESCGLTAIWDGSEGTKIAISCH